VLLWLTFERCESWDVYSIEVFSRLAASTFRWTGSPEIQTEKSRHALNNLMRNAGTHWFKNSKKRISGASMCRVTHAGEANDTLSINAR
jgi:hypothetical protein